MARAGHLPGGRALGALLLAGTGALVLSGCSATQSGQDLAQQACVHVHRSIADWDRAELAGTPASTVALLQEEATEELRDALPLAARANSDDGSWNSLMTTISESAYVDEPHLIPALRAQCVVADTNINVNPQNQNPLPAQNVNP